MLDLADVLELVHDRLNERPLAEQEPIGEREELLPHVLAQLGDEAQSLIEEEVLGQRRGNVALVAKELAKEPTHQARHRTTIVGVARREAKREQLATIIDDQVEFE